MLTKAARHFLNSQMIYLHKDNVADVIIAFMSNDSETHADLMDKAFHSLTYK